MNERRRRCRVGVKSVARQGGVHHVDVRAVHDPGLARLGVVEQVVQTDVQVSENKRLVRKASDPQPDVFG